MKKSQYQQYFHCFIVSVLVPCTFWFGYQQNILTIVISVGFRIAALITGRCLFQCGYPKVWHLLIGSVYLKVWLLVEYSNYSNKCHIQKCEAYQREMLISMWITKGVLLIRGRRLLEEIWYFSDWRSYTFLHFFDTTLVFIPYPANICAFKRLQQKFAPSFSYIKSIGRYLV